MNTQPTQFRVASPANVAALYGTREPDVTGPRAFRYRAERDFRRKQICASELGPLAVLPEIITPEDQGWTQMIDASCAWTDSYIDKLDLNEYAAACHEAPHETKKDVKRIAREGVITIGAFLEVVGRVLLAEEFKKPNTEIAEYVRRSQAFVLGWSGVHRLVDTELAYALAARPKPRQLETLYTADLRFNPKWFQKHEEKQQVILNPGKQANLRGHDDATHPGEAEHGKEVLFGCAGRHWIPRVYSAMAQNAEANGRFKQSYDDERQNYGYDVLV